LIAFASAAASKMSRGDDLRRISGNAVKVITTRNGPADASARPPFMVMAERP